MNLTARVATRPYIVFVGADPADVRLARTVLEEDANANLRVVPDALRTIELLRRDRRRTPALLVIDLDLGDGAAEILAAVHGDDRLTGVPVLLVTGKEDDACDAYRQGASCVILRPRSLDGFFDAMRAIQRFWLETAVLPQR